MAKIIERHEAGLPLGSYDVMYYVLTDDDRVVQEKSYDRGVSAAYVERLAGHDMRAATRITGRTAAVATCRSQPGGMIIYGSQTMRAAMGRSEDD